LIGLRPPLLEPAESLLVPPSYRFQGVSQFLLEGKEAVLAGQHAESQGFVSCVADGLWFLGHGPRVSHPARFPCRADQLPAPVPQSLANRAQPRVVLADHVGHGLQYSTRMPEFANRWEEWEQSIRDPAEQTKEGLRKLAVGPASA